MTGDRFIIEHDTRGVMFEQDYDGDLSPRSYLGWISRWSPTRSRVEAQVFHGTAAVRMAWSRIDPRVRRQVKVRRYGTWSAVPESELRP